MGALHNEGGVLNTTDNALLQDDNGVDCCCPGGPTGCWKQAQLCPCSDQAGCTPPFVYVPCPFVSEGLPFDVSGCCYFVPVGSPTFSTLPPGAIVVEPTQYLSDCIECCDCDHCNAVHDNICGLPFPLGCECLAVSVQNWQYDHPQFGGPVCGFPPQPACLSDQVIITHSSGGCHWPFAGAFPSVYQCTPCDGLLTGSIQCIADPPPGFVGWRIIVNVTPGYLDPDVPPPDQCLFCGPSSQAIGEILTTRESCTCPSQWPGPVTIVSTTNLLAPPTIRIDPC